MKKIIVFLMALLTVLTTVSCSSTPKKVNASPQKTIKLSETGDVLVNSFANKNGYFYRKAKSKTGELIYIKGVNMGLTEPRTDLNNPNTKYDTYYRWFNQISAMNANTVRVFTVMNPNFYNALYDFNQSHKKTPLYLIQGIWFSEDLMYSMTLS